MVGLYGLYDGMDDVWGEATSRSRNVVYLKTIIETSKSVVPIVTTIFRPILYKKLYLQFFVSWESVVVSKNVFFLNIALVFF